MSDFLQDVAFAWRNALKKPATVLLIVVTLALGIGANTAIFSMTWHVLLAPLPYADGERLVKLTQNEPRTDRYDFGWSKPTLADFREQNTAFSDLFEYSQIPLTFVGHGDPWQGFAGFVTGNFFEVLGVRPLLGRTFTMSDGITGAEPVLMLSYESWNGKFAGDPGVVGTTLEAQHKVYKIIGVLPRMPGYPHDNDAWMPTAGDARNNPNRNAMLMSHVLGKLSEGVSLTEASNDVEVITRRLIANYPDDYAEDYVVKLRPLKDEMARDSATTIILLMALAALVVLIASANVANLNLARTMARSQELAIREAVGASQGRIVRQLLAENTMLAVAGGVLGVLIAYPCLSLLADFASGYTPLASEIEMNGTVLGFSFILVIVTGVLGSSASAFNRRDINKALKEGGDKVTTSTSGVYRRNALLAVQCALAFVVLTVSALIMLSLARLNSQDIGFGLDQVLAVNMTLNVDLSEPMLIEQKMRSFSRNVLTAINNIPEVSQAAIRTGAPLLEQVAYSTAFPFEIEGWSAAEPGAVPNATINMISEDYFTMMDIPLLQGRQFLPADDSDAIPVAIVNESFVTRFFPDGNAIGRNIRLSGFDEWRPVVGVVADVRSTDIDQIEGPVVYYSYWQFSVETVNLYVKTAANPELLANTIAGVVHELDPLQSVLVKPLTDIKSSWLAPARLRAVLISLFGALALIVTLSGVIGVVSYNISQRAREIGIHMAIGANAGNIVSMFIAQGFRVYLVGLTLGLVLLLAGAPLLEPLLYETAALNFGIYLLSGVVLTLAVLVAMYLPAKRASTMSPMEALHAE